jgi:hypothetical protein
MNELMIKGRVFKLRTLHGLVLMIVRLRYEQGLNDKIREKIILAGQKCGLLSETEEDSLYRGHRRGQGRHRNILHCLTMRLRSWRASLPAGIPK